MEPDLVPRHPIRVVARRTGLTTATIRAWERRYGAVAPVRSAGGQRLYTDRDLARLDLLRRLTDMGRSISVVAALSPEDAAALLAEDRAAATESERALTADDAPNSWTDQAYQRLRALDDEGLDSTLRRALATLGAHRFLRGVAAPLLRHVGTGWMAGEVTAAQEHLGSAVIDRILAEVAAQAAMNEGGARLVVGTLPGERHAFGARLVAAVAALEGWRVSYLGADLPPDEIAAAAAALGANVVAISMVADEPLAANERALVTLRQGLDSEVELLVGGRASGGLVPRRLPAGIVLLQELDDLRAHLVAAR
jgi:DNA-binding transcriptional MerR regulator/methylmalonyl-CoA mutase cobalamin-binding subunit